MGVWSVVERKNREEQNECTSPGASPQQPKARQGECRGRETGQPPLENGLPQEEATQRGEREGDEGQRPQQREKERNAEEDTEGKLRMRL